jgi:magnesium chelatase family protein
VKFFGVAQVGVRSVLVEVKCVIQKHATGAALLGNARTVVREGWMRARSAIEQCGLHPIGKLGLSFDLKPSQIPKDDPTLDLPLAVVALLAQCKEEVPDPEEPEQRASKAELDSYLREIEECAEERGRRRAALERDAVYSASYILISNLDSTSGDLRRGSGGIVSRLLALSKVQLPEQSIVVVPDESTAEVSFLVKHLPFTVIRATNLREVAAVCLGGEAGDEVPEPTKAQIEVLASSEEGFPDLAKVQGLATAREAAEIAAAGAHHLLLFGPKGVGKSTLAKAMLGLLPRMSQSEFLEVNQIWDAAGRLPVGALKFKRPFCNVSPATSEVALLGGGSSVPKPGLVSCAHCGVLVVDEFNELKRGTIDQLRNPLQDGEIVISRAAFVETFQARFILVATMNPCKCSLWGCYRCEQCNSFLDSDWCPRCAASSFVKSRCTCSLREVVQYRKRVSGPIADRIDLMVKVSTADAYADTRAESSEAVRKRIERAIRVQEKRYESRRIRRNGDLPMLPIPDILEHLGREGPAPQVLDVVREHIKKFGLGKRPEGKVLAVGRTIADLRRHARIELEHVESAIELMGLREPYWQSNFAAPSKPRSGGDDLRSKLSRAVSDWLRRENRGVEDLASASGVAAMVVRRALAGEYAEPTDAVKKLVSHLGAQVGKSSATLRRR